jgi:hypothetical protein
MEYENISAIVNQLPNAPKATLAQLPKATSTDLRSQTLAKNAKIDFNPTPTDQQDIRFQLLLPPMT